MFPLLLWGGEAESFLVKAVDSGCFQISDPSGVRPTSREADLLRLLDRISRRPSQFQMHAFLMAHLLALHAEASPGSGGEPQGARRYCNRHQNC